MNDTHTHSDTAWLNVLAAVVEQTQDAIIITTAQLDEPGPQIVYVNPAFVKMTGYTAAEIIGQTPRILQGPKTNQLLMARLRHNLEMGDTFKGETINYRKDGSEYHLAWIITPVRSAGAEIDYFVSVQRDISQRHAQEERLHRSLLQIEHAKQEWETTVDSLPQLVCLLDDQQRIVRVNRTVEVWQLGLVTQVNGKTLPELFHPQVDLGASFWPELLSEASEAVARGEMLKKRVTDSHLKRHFDILIRPIWAHDAPHKPEEGGHSILVIEDITEQQQLEEQLRHSQKLDAIGQSVGRVAHDFNNILTAILGDCELALAELAADKRVLRHSIEQIQANAQRGERLTQRLLAFGRKSAVHLETINLNELFKKTMPLLTRLIKGAVQLHYHSPPQLGLVKADVSQMEQILVNLIVNANDAMPQAGRIDIYLESVSLPYQPALPDLQAGPYVMLTVCDTGVGIAADSLVRIFEPFFTTKGEKGSGLGLAIVHGIVKQNGGHIAVESQVGQGTTFRVYLPQVVASSEPPPIPKQPTKPISQNGHSTILLVEDEASVQTILRKMLQKQGYHVLAASHSGEAMAHVQANAAGIDLLITDVVLPEGLNGYELAQQLQEQNPRLRVLFVSGYSDQELSSTLPLDAKSAFLKKPFRLDNLTETVETLLANP